MAVAAVIFDWAGTVVDFGSLAPAAAFVEVFREFGVELTIAEARGPMGLAKREHIRALGRIPRVDAAWREAHGRALGAPDVERIHDIFEPLTARVAARYGDLVPGTAETAAELRRRGIRIGSTTGYTRPIMESVLPIAERQGFAPDNLVCAGDLPAGRPTPLMMYRCFVDLAVWPAAAAVKVDDTAPGIEEATAAGSWAVGVAMSGNAVGLPLEELAGLDPATTAHLRKRAAAELRTAGAHYVIDTVANLLSIIEAIDAQLAAGNTPSVLQAALQGGWAAARSHFP